MFNTIRKTNYFSLLYYLHGIILRISFNFVYFKDYKDRLVYPKKKKNENEKRTLKEKLRNFYSELTQTTPATKYQDRYNNIDENGE